jgi:hypothetical protein
MTGRGQGWFGHRPGRGHGAYPGQVPSGGDFKEEGVNDQGQPEYGWTVVLRRRPIRIVDGRAEGGYTDAYEIVCCDCGDHPDLDYRQVSAALQQIRGLYPLLAGVAAYEKHVRRHRARPVMRHSARPAPRRRRLSVRGLSTEKHQGSGPGALHVLSSPTETGH